MCSFHLLFFYYLQSLMEFFSLFIANSPKIMLKCIKVPLQKHFDADVAVKHFVGVQDLPNEILIFVELLNLRTIKHSDLSKELDFFKRTAQRLGISLMRHYLKQSFILKTFINCFLRPFRPHELRGKYVFFPISGTCKLFRLSGLRIELPR